MLDRNSLAIQEAILLGIKQDAAWEGMETTKLKAERMIREGNEMLIDIEAKIGHNKIRYKEQYDIVQELRKNPRKEN